MSDVTMSGLPETFARTRDELHQIAFFAMSPARYRAVGRMGLRHRPGGFGTPEFGGKVARVDEDLLVLEQGEQTATQVISTVRGASQFFGVDYEVGWFDGFRDPLLPTDPDRPLEVDPEATRAIGRWFEFGWSVLGELRARAGDSGEVTEIQLWPEHFDAALEMGDQDRGERASFGVSPGDVDHPEPYVYVAAWGDIDRSNPYWNDRTFNGASLGHRQLLESGDPGSLALDFLFEGLLTLHR